jgi:hypothetical protein
MITALSPKIYPAQLNSDISHRVRNKVYEPMQRLIVTDSVYGRQLSEDFQLPVFQRVCPCHNWSIDRKQKCDADIVYRDAHEADDRTRYISRDETNDGLTVRKSSRDAVIFFVKSWSRAAVRL